MEICIGGDERLAQARALVASLEAGDEAEADRILDSFPHSSDNELFQEVGRLTRELHDSIVGSVLDDDVMRVANRRYQTQQSGYST